MQDVEMTEKWYELAQTQLMKSTVDTFKNATKEVMHAQVARSFLAKNNNSFAKLLLERDEAYRNNKQCDNDSEMKNLSKFLYDLLPFYVSSLSLYLSLSISLFVCTVRIIKAKIINISLSYHVQ